MYSFFEPKWDTEVAYYTETEEEARQKFKEQFGVAPGRTIRKMPV